VSAKAGRDTKRAVLLLVAASVVLRVSVLLHPTLGVLDSDEAVTGLMALGVFEGDLPIFYWGQAYGGTLEVLLVAGLFALFSASALVLKAAPLLLAMVATLLLWRIGRRILGPQQGALAAAVFLAWPGFFVWMSTKERGFYWAALVLALSTLLLALRLQERQRWWEAAALGLTAGAGWWTTPQTALLLLPATAWLLWRSPRLLRTAPFSLLGFLLGAAPWLLYNHRHSWPSRWQPIQAEDGWLVAHFWGFFWRALPRAYGATTAFSGELLVPVALVGIGLFALAAWQRRPGLAVAVAVAYPFLFALIPPGWTPEPRYLFFLHPAIALLVAGGLAKLPCKAIVTFVGSIVLASGMSLAALAGTVAVETRAPDIAAPTNLEPITTALLANNADRVFADYWIAYRLVFESGEKIVATPLGGALRNDVYERRVQSSNSPAYVFVKGSSFVPFFGPRLSELGVEYRRVDAGGYVAYLPESRVLPKDIWP
jgi:hypothetical protein